MGQKRRKSLLNPSEGTTHQDRLRTSNSHKKSNQIPIFLESYSFSLGFKMRLICNHQLLTNTQAKAKATSLKAHQARFLSQMETCSTWEPATLDLIDKQTQANLQQIIMNIPDPVQPTCKLFHAVNKMYIHDGFIF